MVELLDGGDFIWGDDSYHYITKGMLRLYIEYI